MALVVYKIVNSVNDKVYIGQTIRPLDERFARHIREAMNNPKTSLKIQRAIRKYGGDKFRIYQIDEASTREELNELEKYWIRKYDSVNNGYNMTEGGDGGNTYMARNEEQMKDTKNKLSKANFGKNNGMSKQFKAMNVKTGKEYFFDTLVSCLEFLGTKHKETVVCRANKECNTLWRNEWKFAYADEEYGEFNEFHYDPSCRKGKKVILSKDGEEFKFNSMNKASQFLNVKKMSFESGMTINGYLVEVP